MVQTTVLVDEWRYLIQTLAGVRSVIVPGVLPIVMSFAVSWASLEQFGQEMLLITVKEVVPSCWSMFAAMAMNHTFGIALIMDGINTPVHKGKRVWNVQCARKVISLME